MAPAPGAVWAVAEVLDGAVTRLSTEVATVTRRLGDAAGREAVGVVIASDPDAAAAGLAGFLPRVIAIAAPEAAGLPWAGVAAAHLAALAGGSAPSL